MVLHVSTGLTYYLSISNNGRDLHMQNNLFYNWNNIDQ